MPPSSIRRPPKKSTPRKSASTSLSKKDAKSNTSILTFFKKVETEATLFYGVDASASLEKEDAISHCDQDASEEELSVELESPPKQVKRRKLSHTEDAGPETVPKVVASTVPPGPASAQPPGRSPIGKTVGGFVLDSDSEDDERMPDVPSANRAVPKETNQSGHLSMLDATSDDCNEEGRKPALSELFEEPGTSIGADCMGDVDEEFLGEEYREMLFSQEQARLEAEEAGIRSSDDFPPTVHPDDSMIEACPICKGSLVGATPDESTRHVNSCLDGNPTPLPAQTKPYSPNKFEPEEIAEIEHVRGRMMKAAIPRPGQRNPFSLATDAEGSSAFSKLMSGNAENSAWAAAAAAETASRGKQAYQRTCPFYKIMPGFSICVDAFRYGAVKDCNAYFLSHFHSDHYVGLTGSWKHGPIYCSRVTGRLVKQQLKVEQKWVVELEFDEPFEIPGTNGATVVMIPANHCPGSSMFLFEKKVAKGPNNRTQRILHCGDFRACPAHVNHDRLKPNVLDEVSGKLRQQRIDICYLDTTYLSPRYSFPPQSDVISACADICSSLNADASASEAAWGKLGRETGTTTVSRFFKDNSKNDNPAEAEGPQTAQNRLLVVCGTYSIGKERICVAIAKALKSKIFASASKIRMFRLLDDPELSSLLTSDPREAQVHMQMLMEIRAETLQEYLNGYKPHFSRIVGFRPSGWNYRPVGASKLISSNTQPGTVATTQILHGKAWRTRFTVDNLEKQRGSTKEAMCFGVPYSEHSSFRELALFLMSLRIERVIPTVNVGSEASRRKMKGWIDKWLADRAKGGILKPQPEGANSDAATIQEWDGKGTNRDVWW
ncbi:hypothetical protein jhhlp_007198 [Lomentospora prolificans]|uniref:DNA repair metallo-beta-lactamase domain-containing protein n=1 Tax=Lomentospora prolificans TaxID=41688 RepID=A0A2N3N203_9PEZI|nr:hypothetical protein jhhlp_007198 [Lomentospora prolificans]